MRVGSPLPDVNARDPHTLNFDQSGMLWFTVQQANMIGRLDPATGAIKLVTSPTPKSRPYGLKIDARVCRSLSNSVPTRSPPSIPQTMAIREYALPDAAARPRRLAIDPDGMVWYVDFSRGYLGRLDLATGAVKEWPSPSGAKSEPYGIVFTARAGLVQRVRGQAEYNRAVRSGDQKNSRAGRFPAAAISCAIWM